MRKLCRIVICMLAISLIVPLSAAGLNTISNEDTDPDLNCLGEIAWNDIIPGTIIKNVFYVENIGGPISELDWEIIDWPEWGNWYFLPPDGENLKPNDGAVTIYVFLEVPNDLYENYNGNITIINKENTSDFEIMPVTLSTPVNQDYMNLPPLFQRLCMRFPFLFQMLHYLCLK